jgi:hypothetical protein
VFISMPAVIQESWPVSATTLSPGVRASSRTGKVAPVMRASISASLRRKETPHVVSLS